MNALSGVEIREAVFEWWRTNLGDRETNPAARGLAARVRRAYTVEILAEPTVHSLARDLRLGNSEHDANCLIRIASVLAEVRTNGTTRFAARLGKAEAMSLSRFERLIRSGRHDVATAIRRSLPMIDRQCNVGWLGSDLLFWNDRIRTRWCFEYFGSNPPSQHTTEETT